MNEFLRLKKISVLFKYILIIMVLIFVIVPLYKSISYRKALQDFVVSGDDLGMIDSVLSSFDTRGNPYKIKSRKAIHKNQYETIFYDMVGSLKSEKYEKINFYAERGEFNNQKEVFNLYKGVRIGSLGDFELYAVRANFFVEKDYITGYENIVFNNHIGDFSAEEFGFKLNSKKYHFERSIVLKFNSTRKDATIWAGIVDVDDNIYRIDATRNPIYEDFEIRLDGDKFEIYYKPNEEGGEDEIQIDKIYVNDNVKVNHADVLITGDEANFFPEKEEIEVMGDVVLYNKKNTIKGEKLIYYMKDSSVRIVKISKEKVKVRYRDDKKDNLAKGNKKGD